MTRQRGFFFVALLTGCGEDKVSGPPPLLVGGFDTGTTDDTGTPPAPELSACEQLGLTARAFDPETSSLPKRHSATGDFTVPLVDGTEWTLSEQWTGCESYIFLPHDLSVDEADGQSWWVNGIDGLFEKSPPNAHYFFIVTGNNPDHAAYTGPLADDIATQLARLDEADQAWWSERLHVVEGSSNDLSGFIKTAFQGNIGRMGFAVDRFQKFRTLGSMAAVEAYDSALSWPWERRIYDAGYQPAYYNFEIERQDRLDAEDALVVEVLSGEEYSQYQDGILVLPENIEDFDTLEIDVIMECPNTLAYELGNCGAWDYLAHMWLWEDYEEDARKSDGSADTGSSDDTGTSATDTGSPSDTGSSSPTEDPADTGSGDTGEPPPDPEPEPEPPAGQWHEMARFITTYHRESRWVVDASHALAWLKAGEERTVRYEWAPSWNPQPTIITTRFRFTNRGKAGRPAEIVHLYGGGGFNADYNELRPEQEVDIPADVARVELVAITTGHGMSDDGNCAEFCDHSHHFTVNGSEWVQDLDDPGLSSGCADKVSDGVVPNQAGTWWFGRGGWCPGQRVDPFTVDVTEVVSPGSPATVLYQAMREGREPSDGSGNIVHNSWLVYYR